MSLNYLDIADTRPFAHGTQPVLITWTDDFSDTFKAARGYNIVDRLPEVVWDLSDGPNTARYLFTNHACQRFADGFSAG